MFLLDHFADFRLWFHRRRLMSEINGGEHLHLEGIINVVAPEKLFLGTNVHIGRGAYLNCLGRVSIGDYTIISRHATIYSYDHDFKSGDMLPFGPKTILKPVEIGRYVWIGMNVCIAPGTKIGDGAIIGLGAVVSGLVPENAICVNAKTRIVGYRDPKITADLAARKQFLSICEGTQSAPTGFFRW
jgi:acetyltransferase-like isoleucine patch superfamily enzyme